MGIADSVLAYVFDDALNLRLVAAEQEAMQRAKNPSNGQIPAGTVYERVADVVH